MTLDNCQKCGKIFQRTLNPICKGCYAYEQEKKMAIYRYIQENPDITPEEVSETFEIPVNEVTTLIHAGSLGTANQVIRTHCALCNCEMTALNRVGYFCKKCNSTVEHDIDETRPEILEEPAKEIYIPSSSDVGDSALWKQGKQANSPQPSREGRKEHKYGFRRVFRETKQ